jgi:hypothetical protein
LVKLAVSAGANDGLDADMIAADVSEHIADDAERRDHGDPIRGPPRNRHQQDDQHRDERPDDAKATKHQRLPRMIGAKRRNVLVVTSETPNSNPPTSTIAGPEGRLP